MTIEDAGYTSTTEVVNLAPEEEVMVEFDTWTNYLGQFTVDVCTELSTDENQANNCMDLLVEISENARQKVVLEIATGTW